MKVDLESYRSQGFTVVRGVAGPPELKALADACDELCEMAKDFEKDTFLGVTFFNLHRDCDPFARDIGRYPQRKGVLRRVTYPYAVSRTLDRFRTHGPLLEVIRQILGDDVVQIVNQVNFNPPGIGTGWGWHQDYRFRRQGIDELRTSYVQCLLAIDRCDDETGGLRLVPGSDALGGLKLDLDPERAEEQFDASKAVRPVLEPGDCVLFNPYVIHGSTPNRSTQQRRVYINGYADARRSTRGTPVLVAGAPVREARGAFEWEDDPERLALAAKY